MSTRHTLYQLRRQKARYDIPSCEVEEWNEWWVSETHVPRGWVFASPIALASLFIVVLALFCMLWCACDMAVDLAKQAYGVVI